MRSQVASVSSVQPLEDRFLAASSTVQGFERILVATNLTGSDLPAVRIAVHLASLFKAKLLVLHVFEYWRAASEDMLQTVEGIDNARRSAERKLDRIMKVVHRSTLAAQFEIKSGFAFHDILSTAAAKRSNLIVLGTGGLHGMNRAIFGSTAESVLHQVSCPVLVVGPGAAKISKSGIRSRPIVFATDFNEETTGAVRSASLCSEALEAPLHCIHVLPASIQEQEAHLVSEIMVKALQRILEKEQVQVGTTICSTTSGEDVPTGIIRYAQEHDAQLIILGVRHASAIASHLPAHVSYSIITGAPCPVLTIAASERLKPKVP